MDFLPKRNGDRIAWLNTLKNKITTFQAQLDLTDADVQEILTIIDAAIKKMQAVEDSLTAYQSTVVTKDAMETNGEIKTLRGKINQWKAADDYTDSIGTELGIVAPSSPIDVTLYKANLSGSVEADIIRLKFKKMGADSINIYKRKKGSPDWTFLARDTATPYDDHITLTTPGQPEHWEYIGFGVLRDEQIGAPSNIIQIVYGGLT